MLPISCKEGTIADRTTIRMRPRSKNPFFCPITIIVANDHQKLLLPSPHHHQHSHHHYHHCHQQGRNPHQHCFRQPQSGAPPLPPPSRSVHRHSSHVNSVRVSSRLAIIVINHRHFFLIEIPPRLCHLSIVLLQIWTSGPPLRQRVITRNN